MPVIGKRPPDAFKFVGKNFDTVFIELTLTPENVGNSQLIDQAFSEFSPCMWESQGGLPDCGDSLYFVWCSCCLIKRIFIGAAAGHKYLC